MHSNHSAQSPKKTIQCLAFDLDGTLLNAEHRIAPLTLQVLLKLQQQFHIQIALVSGRSLTSISKLSQQLSGLRYHVISENGAHIHHARHGVLHSNLFNQTELQPLFKTLLPLHNAYFIHLFKDEQWWVSDTAYQPPVQFIGEIYGSFSLENPPLERISKVFITHRTPQVEPLQSLQQQLQSQFPRLNIQFSTKNCLDVTSDLSNKGLALRQLLTKLDLPLSHCMAFGDAMNDIDMLSMVGHGVLMGNALPDLHLALPDNPRAGHHDNEGVALYLSEYFELTLP